MVGRRLYNNGDAVNCIHHKIFKNCRVIDYSRQYYCLQDIKTLETFSIKSTKIKPGHYYIFIPQSNEPQILPLPGYTQILPSDPQVSFI